MSDLDYPFEEVTNSARRLVNERGATTFQKFTCSLCGARQTMETPNTFYTSGRCEECGAITNIAKAGCNFVAVLPLAPRHSAQGAPGGSEHLRRVGFDTDGGWAGPWPEDENENTGAEG